MTTRPRTRRYFPRMKVRGARRRWQVEADSQRRDLLGLQAAYEAFMHSLVPSVFQWATFDRWLDRVSADQGIQGVQEHDVKGVE